MSIGNGPQDAGPTDHQDPTQSGGSGGWTPSDPGPLGLAAFALTTFVLSMMNANLVNFDKGLPVVLGLALAYGGICQLLAGMWEFRTGNTFGAVAFTSYGGFWISFFVLMSNSISRRSRPTRSTRRSASTCGRGRSSPRTCSSHPCARPRRSRSCSCCWRSRSCSSGSGNSGGNASIIHIGGYIGIATRDRGLVRIVRGGCELDLGPHRAPGDYRWAGDRRGCPFPGRGRSARLTVSAGDRTPARRPT